MRKSGSNTFWSSLLVLAAVVVLVKWIIPAVSRYLTGLPFPLTVPASLQALYIGLALIGLVVYVTYSDAHMKEFWQPIARLLRAEYGTRPRLAVLLIVPLLTAGWVYEQASSSQQPPTYLRIQHPSSNFPKEFEHLRNPFAEPATEDVKLFIDQVQNDALKYIPQLANEFHKWQQQHPEQHSLELINLPAVREFMAQVKSNEVALETARAALIEKHLFEGRALYAINCRTCHGDSTGGDGPMADGFKLRPIDFTGSGTIETLFAGYAFWRVAYGGRGLPAEATPWDSSMPEWKASLTEDEQWLILLATYDLARKSPLVMEFK